MQTKLYIKIVALLLVMATLFSLVACDTSGDPPSSDKPSWLNPSLSDPNENTLQEDHITEDIINEIIITESYLVELVEVENKISELLLAEDMINEVILCKTIYIPQEHIEEFADNSQTEQLFGEGIDLKSLATKIAIGTGLIITTVVLTKVGIPEPVVSLVIKPAMKQTIKGAAVGTAVGSVYGGLTGAVDEVDTTQRTSAIIGVAVSTVFLIISVVELVAAIPSGGASIGVGEGIKIGVAAVFALSAAAGTATSAVNAVKTFKATDATEVDWNNIDWDKVGVSAAEQAINSSADGFMWGSVAGLVQGGAEGYANYEKYYTPYSTKLRGAGEIYNGKTRHDIIPAENSKIGKWSGTRGESDFILNEPLVLNDGTVVTKVTYKNAVPDFSPYQLYKVKIDNMTANRETGPNCNFAQANKKLADIFNKSKYQGKTNWDVSSVNAWRKANNLTWHEMNNMQYMQLVPTEVNATFKHLGGCGEYNAMVGSTGGVTYD